MNESGGRNVHIGGHAVDSNIHTGDIIVQLPGAPVETPYQSPPLPGHFVFRPEVAERLKRALMCSTEDALVVSAVHGLGGIGKSTLSAALVRDPDVQRHFKDGILWTTLGQNPDLRRALTDCISSLGSFSRPSTPEGASFQLQALLRQRRTLLVVDDAWDPSHVLPFLVGGPECRVLITTREAVIARRIHVPAALFDLEVMTPGESLELLAGRLGKERLEGEEARLALALADEVGYLPLALELAAAQVADGLSWRELLAGLAEEVARLEVLQLADYEEVSDEVLRKKLSLPASFHLSLRRLPDSLREALAWLGVLPEDVEIGAALGVTLWDTDERQAQATLERLHSKALLMTGLGRPGGAPTYRLHDLVYDLARRLLTAPSQPAVKRTSPGLGLTFRAAHAALLDRYRQRTRNGQWHTLPDDGYIQTHLTYHLIKAGRTAEIDGVLRETADGHRNGWYQACDGRGQTASFLADVERAWTFAEGERPVVDAADAGPGAEGGTGEVRLDLCLRYALMLSSLRSLAQNIPPGLLRGLVDKGVWSASQALAVAQQVPDPTHRAEALSQLTSHLSGKLLERLLETVRQMASPDLRAATLANVALSLPAGLRGAALEEALGQVRSLQSEEAQAGILAVLGPRLAELGYPREALDAAFLIQPAELRRGVLLALAVQLPEIAGDAADRALAAGDPDVHDSLLHQRVRTLAGEERLEEAMTEAGRLQDPEVRQRSLCGLVGLLPAHLAGRMAGELRALPSPDRDEAFQSLWDRLLQIGEPVLAVGLLREPWLEERRLAALANALAALPRPALQEAWAALELPGEERDRALSALAVRLLDLGRPEEALDAALEIRPVAPRQRLLVSLVGRVPAAWQGRLVELVRSLPPDRCAVALTEMAERLDPAALDLALDAVPGLQDAHLRDRALAALVPRLEACGWTARALEAAEAVTQDQEHDALLSGLIGRLAEAGKLEDALAAVPRLRAESERVAAAHILVPLLTQSGDFTGIVTLLSDLDSFEGMFEILAMSAQIRPALELLRARDPEKALSFQRLGLRSQREAWEQIDRRSWKRHSDSALACRLARAWVTAAGNGETPSFPEFGGGEDAEVCVFLETIQLFQPVTFESFPQSLVPEAFRCGLAIRSAPVRARWMTALAPRLPPVRAFAARLLALRSALAVPDREERLRALVELVGFLPGPLRRRLLGELRKDVPELLEPGQESLLQLRLVQIARCGAPGEALWLLEGVRHPPARLDPYLQIAPHLDGPLRDRAVQAVLDLAPYWPLETRSGWTRARLMAYLAGRLIDLGYPGLARQAAQSRRHGGDLEQEIEATVGILARLPAAMQREAWLELLPDLRFRRLVAGYTDLVLDLAARLWNEGAVEEAVGTLSTASEEPRKWQRLEEAALKLVTAGQPQLALGAALRITERDRRIRLLLQLARLDERTRQAALQESLRALGRQTSLPPGVLIRLALTLPEQDRERVLDTLLEILREEEGVAPSDRDGESGDEAFVRDVLGRGVDPVARKLAALAGFLLEAGHPEAVLQVVWLIQEKTFRAGWLLQAAQRTAGPARVRAFQVVARSLAGTRLGADFRWQALAEMAAGLPEPAAREVASALLRALASERPGFDLAVEDLCLLLQERGEEWAAFAITGLDRQPRDEASLLVRLALRTRDAVRIRLLRHAALRLRSGDPDGTPLATVLDVATEPRWEEPQVGLLLGTVSECLEGREKDLMEPLAALLVELVESGSLETALQVAKAIRETGSGSLEPRAARRLLARGRAAEARALAAALPPSPLRSGTLAGLAADLARCGSVALAIQVVRDLEDEQIRAQALGGIAPHLPEELLREALSEVWKMARAESILRGVSGIAPHLPIQLLRQTLERLRVINDAGPCLRRRAELLLELIVSGAAAATLGEGAGEEEILTALVDADPAPLAAWIRETREARDLLTEEASRARILSALFPRLPEGLQGRALRVAKNFRDRRSRALFFEQVALTAPGSLLDDVLDELRWLPDEPRARALAQLAPRVPSGLARRYLSACGSLRQEQGRTRALLALVPVLPTELYPHLLRRIGGITSSSRRSELLISCAPRLMARHLRRALRLAAGIERPMSRARTLVALSGRLPSWLQAECLGFVRRIYAAEARCFALASLVGLLSGRVAEEALETLSRCRSPLHRRRALLGVAPRLPSPRREELLRNCLLPLLRAGADPGLVRELAASCGPASEPLERWVVQLVASLPEDSRTRAAVLLAPLLPGGSLAGSHGGSAGGPKRPRSSAPLPVWQEPALEEALDEALSDPDSDLRAERLLGLLPTLGIPELTRALEEIVQWERGGLRAEMLREVAHRAATLPRETLAGLFASQAQRPGLLRLLAEQPRQELLEDLVLLAPVLLARNEQGLVLMTADAIDEVCRWWP